LLPGAAADFGQLLSGAEPVPGNHARAQLVLAGQAGHPNHKKLIEVVEENGQELETLQKRVGLIGGLGQNFAVEFQPVEFPVEQQFPRAGPFQIQGFLGRIDTVC